MPRLSAGELTRESPCIVPYVFLPLFLCPFPLPGTPAKLYAFPRRTRASTWYHYSAAYSYFLLYHILHGGYTIVPWIGASRAFLRTFLRLQELASIYHYLLRKEPRPLSYNRS